MMQRKDVPGATRFALAAALSAVWAGAAYADDASEQDLRKQVQDLQKELTELKDTVRGGYFTASSDLEARVSELERAAGDSSFSSTYKNGMRSETADGAFKYQVGGWFQNDWFWFPGENDYDDADLDAGTNFNAARLYVQGQLYGNIGFKTEYDFSADEGEFKDVWMEIRNCTLGTFRVGHMKEPLGLETLTDDKFTTFMNRNSTHALMPNRNTGMMLYGNVLKDALLYQVGLFRTTENDHGSDQGPGSSSQAMTGRLSMRPFAKEDGRTYLHIGGGMSFRDEDDVFTLSSYKPVGNAATFPTVSVAIDSMWIGELEAAFVAGGLIFKLEYAHTETDGPSSGPDARFDAWALEGGFWLTGDQWSYSKDSGSFSRPTVGKNFGEEKGRGAWQLAARIDTINPDVGGVSDDKVDTYTLGVNWFLNPNTRISLNLSRVSPQGPIDAFDWLGVRFQLDF